jgi:hypothetical protein
VVVRNIAHLLKPPRSDHQQPDYHYHQMHTGRVATEFVLTTSMLNATIQTDYLKVLVLQLQSATRTQLSGFVLTGQGLRP